ncbi:unnamed protein product [Cuscuta epithymum]|uniref:MATH domain-containing protein n=1 Tax=Cuscuta epithymum TaxID=186058 RepID=A0AAV0EJF7_9ASTE|nr:unnamed protein product [Cuscuta epithymum]
MTSKFTWRIEDFSKIKHKKIYSVTFVVNEYKWRLCLFPKGSQTDHLSLFLRVADASSLPDGWSITTKFSLALINQIDPNKTIKRDRESKYEAQSTSRGYTSFIWLSKFHNQSEGYLVDDICLVETEISMLTDASLASNDKVVDSSVALDLDGSVYVEAQSFLESLPKRPSSFGCTGSNDLKCEMDFLKGTSHSAKEILDTLISHPLDVLAEPRNETAILESLSSLTAHIYLKATFPEMIQEWRRQSKGRSGHPWSSFEHTRNLLEDLVKGGEGIKAKLEKLYKKEREFEAQLEAIENCSLSLKEERQELLNQIKIAYTLAEEQARNYSEAEEVEVDLAIKKLRLKSKWAATRLLFY